MRRRRPGLAIVVAAALVTSGCQATFDVDVQSQSDGRGLVAVTANLDRDAAEQSKLMGLTVRADDLRAAGWSVTGPTDRPNGGLSYRVSKQVDSPEQATAALAALGPPFASIEVRRDHSLSRTKFTVRGAVDLQSGADAFGDDVLRRRLGSSSALGIDTPELERQLGRPANEALRFNFHADVPGANPRDWVTPLGARTPIELMGEVRHYDTVIPLLIGLIAAGLCVVLVVGQSRVRARQRGRPRVYGSDRGVPR